MPKTTVSKKIKAKQVEDKIEVAKNDLVATVYSVDAQEEKVINLPKEIFGVKVNSQILAQYVRVYLINQRQGTASTKTRSEVTGSTRKIYRQKGTGKARHGDIKAPIFTGGGIVGGPKPKNYQANINKKLKKIALIMALSHKEKEKKVFVLSDKFKEIDGKTKTIVNFFKKLNCLGEKILFILPTLKKSRLVLAARNVSKIEIGNVASINPYQLLNTGRVFFLEESLKILSDRLKRK